MNTVELHLIQSRVIYWRVNMQPPEYHYVWKMIRTGVLVETKLLRRLLLLIWVRMIKFSP